MRVSYTNHKQIKAKLQRLMPERQAAVRKAVDREMGEIFKETQESVPVRTGDLKETGTQYPAEGQEVIEASIGYGKQRKGFYAAPVEARKSYLGKHAKAERIGKAIRDAFLKGK